MRTSLVCLAVLSGACASAPIKPPVAQSLAAADALVLQGCYSCLTQALAIYDQAAVGRARPLIVARLFQTNLLIALREKELDLPAEPAIARAAALIAELPPGSQPERYVTMVRDAYWNRAGWPGGESDAFFKAHDRPAPEIDADIVWLAPDGPSQIFSAPFRQYLALTLDCQNYGRSRGSLLRGYGEDKHPPLASDAPPLVRYRAATCVALDHGALTAIHDTVPAFTETSLVLGQDALGDPDEIQKPAIAGWLRDAQQAFPASPLANQLAGRYAEAVGDCDTALVDFGAALSVKPNFEDALLGRAMCETYLKHADAAIEAASTIIRLGHYDLGEAYYYRGWNRWTLGQLDQARDDAAQAKARRFSSSSFSLAGMIEHDQNDLDAADRDLAKAVELDDGNCDAHWYQGLVAIKRQTWSAAADFFAGATGCYAGALAKDQAARARMAAAEGVDEAVRARRLAILDASIADDRTRRADAALNASANYVSSGRLEQAKLYLQMAASDPSLADKVALLKKYLP